MNAAFLLAVLAGLIGAGPAWGAHEASILVELRPRALAAADPDSVRLGQAIDLWNQGTVEGRRSALQRLDDLKSRFWDESAYHLLRGIAYLDGRRASNAREALRLAIERDSTSIEARTLLARSLLDEMLADLSDQGVGEATRQLDAVLADADLAATEPRPLSAFERAQYKSARFRKALLLFHRKRFVTALSEKVHLSREALALLEPITSGYPRGVESDACMLRAMLALDLDEPGEASRWFDHMLAISDLKRKSVFRVPPQLNDDPDFKQAGSTVERGAIADRYWEGFRSDDGSLNPEQLEYFYNTGLALLYFPDRRVDGEGVTMVGQAVQRFGLPETKVELNPTFDELSAANALGDPGLGVAHDRTSGARNEQVALMYPGGMTLNFERAVDGSYAAANFSTLRLTSSPALPPVVPIPTSDTIDGMYLTAAGFQGGGGRTRERFVVCVPPWSSAPDWWTAGSYAWELINSQGVTVASWADDLDATHFYDTGVPAERGVLLIGDEASLAPGNYHLRFHIENRFGDERGTMRFRLVVPAVDGARLALSDLSLAMPGTERWSGGVVRRPDMPFMPNALGAIRRGEDAVLYYNIYNLSPAIEGLDYGRCAVQLQVVPVRYRQDFGRREASGKLRDADRARFGQIGDRAGDVVLDPGNSQTVFFPERSLRLVQKTENGLPGLVISTASLAPGKYRAVVTLRDTRAKVDATREVSFHVVDDETYEAVWGRSN